MNIKQLRKKVNLTQEQLANKLGVSWTTISRWENNKTKPSHLAQKEIDRLIEGKK